MLVPSTSAPAATIASRSPTDAPPPTNTGTAGRSNHRGQAPSHDFSGRIERCGEDDACAMRAARSEGHLFERRAASQENDTQSAIVCGEREYEQADLVLLIGQAGSQHGRTATAARTVMKSRAELVSNVHRKEVLFGDGAFAAFPPATELAQHWQQQAIGHRLDRVRGERRRVHLLELRVIEARNGGNDMLARAAPGILFSSRFRRSRRRHRARDLADRQALLQEPENLVDEVDLPAVVQAVTARRAHGLDEPIAALPGAQRDDIDAREVRNRTDREQLRRL